MIKKWISKSKYNKKVSNNRKLCNLNRARIPFRDWLIRRDSEILNWSMTRKSHDRDVEIGRLDEANREVGAVRPNTIGMSNSLIRGRVS